jgi:hypothetical protein
MGALERLDDPIDRPMMTQDDRHKRTYKARATHPRMVRVGPRDMTIDGSVVLFGIIGSMEGRDVMIQKIKIS